MKGVSARFQDVFLPWVSEGWRWISEFHHPDCRLKLSDFGLAVFVPGISGDFFWCGGMVLLIFPWKLTCHLKRDHLKRNIVFQPWYFRGYCSFHGSILFFSLQRRIYGWLAYFYPKIWVDFCSDTWLQWYPVSLEFWRIVAGQCLAFPVRKLLTSRQSKEFRMFCCSCHSLMITYAHELSRVTRHSIRFSSLIHLSLHWSFFCPDGTARVFRAWRLQVT